MKCLNYYAMLVLAVQCTACVPAKNSRVAAITGRAPESACETTPCENGGSCTDTASGAVCSCPNGVSGAHCELIADDPLAELSDEFNSPQSLTDWDRLYTVEQWPVDQLQHLDISQTQTGWARLVPYTSAWFEDYRGALLFKSVSGNFIVSTRVAVSNRSLSGPPSRVFSLAGLMVRTPTAMLAPSWLNGRQNYVFVGLGAADDTARFQAEVKTTRDSMTTVEPAYSPVDPATQIIFAELRIARVGGTLICMMRYQGLDWQILQRYARPDMPATVQVGLTAYADWTGVAPLTPETHNATQITTEQYPESLADIDARFDYVRFATPTVPVALNGLALSDRASVSDQQLIAFLGND